MLRSQQTACDHPSKDGFTGQTQRNVAAVCVPGRERIAATVSGNVTWGMKRAKQPEDLCVRFSHFPDLNLYECQLIPNCFMRHLKLCKQ